MEKASLIAPTDRFEKGDSHEISAAPDGYVVHQVGKDRVHFLNEVAAAVFELCDGKNDVATIEDFVASAFAKISPPADAVRSCLSILLAEELVKPCTPSSSGP
jgi:hypothetical protein